MGYDDLALSYGNLMLLLGLARIGPSSVVARLGTLLLGIACIGLVVTAIFPTDLEEARSTHTGDIHTMSFLVNVGSTILAVVLLLSVSFGSDPRWHTYRRTALTMAAVVVIAFVLQFLTLHRGAPYGLANRFFVAMLLAWLLTTSIRLRVLARDRASEA